MSPADRHRSSRGRVALEQACRVIRFDKRGTGLSDPTGALPDMDQRVVDLAAVMNAAGSQAAVMFGVSDQDCSRTGG